MTPDTAREVIKKARSLNNDLSKWDCNWLDEVHFSDEQLSAATNELAVAYETLWPGLHEEYRYYTNDSRQVVAEILLGRDTH